MGDNIHMRGTYCCMGAEADTAFAEEEDTVISAIHSRNSRVAVDVRVAGSFEARSTMSSLNSLTDSHTGDCRSLFETTENPT